MASSSIFFNAEDFFDMLRKLPITADSIVNIATYSIYLNITNGKDMANKFGPSVTRQFINRVKGLSSFKLIVGAPYFVTDLMFIPEYIDAYNDSVKRLSDTVKILNLNYKIHPSSHLKYYRVDNRVFVGGINLTHSKWSDVIVEITDEAHKELLAKEFEKLYTEGTKDINIYYKSTKVNGVTNEKEKTSILSSLW